MRRKVKNSGKVPEKPTFCFCASIAFRMRATSDEAKLVHLLCLQRQRGVRFDQIGIERVAARHPAQPDAVARLGEIFALQEVAHPLVRGLDDILDLLRVGGTQARLVGWRYRRRKGLDRAVEDRTLDALLQQVVELLDHVADDELGLDDALRLALPEQDDRSVERGSVSRVALQIVLVIEEGLEGCRALPAREFGVERLDSVEMVEREQFEQREQFGRITAQADLRLLLEHIVGDLVDIGQLGAVDAREAAQVGLRRGLLGEQLLFREPVAQTVGIAQVAAEDRLDRVAPEAGLVAVVKQLLQPGVLGGITRLRRRRL